jgi:hypothetical protein
MVEKVGIPKKVFPFFVKYSQEGSASTDEAAVWKKNQPIFCYMTFSCFFDIVITEISLR